MVICKSECERERAVRRPRIDLHTHTRRRTRKLQSALVHVYREEGGSCVEGGYIYTCRLEDERTRDGQERRGRRGWRRRPDEDDRRRRQSRCRGHGEYSAAAAAAAAAW